MTTCYLDASALVKLATEEAESEALRTHLAAYGSRISSRVATVEVPRALARKGGAEGVAVTWAEVIGSLVLIELDELVAAAAADLVPAALRSLDAIHLATAKALGNDLKAFVTYDARLADAARAAGMTVVAPA